jgi:hypothetical protein
MALCLSFITQVMLFQNLGGFVIILAVCLATGDLVNGVNFCTAEGSRVVWPLLLFAASNFIGGYFVLSLNKRFGALVMTLTRSV